LEQIRKLTTVLDNEKKLDTPFENYQNQNFDTLTPEEVSSH